MQTPNLVGPNSQKSIYKTPRRALSWAQIIATGAIGIMMFSAVPLTGGTAFAQLGVAAIHQDASLNTTVRGTISRLSDPRLGGTGYFEMRAESGEALRVLTNQDIRFVMESRNFLVNTRIEVEGARDGDAMIARDVRFFDNGRYVSYLRGVVQSSGNNKRLQLLVGTRVVQVTTNNVTTQRRVRRGDVVELTGTWQDLGRNRWNSVFVARSVTLVQDNGAYPGDNNYENGQLTSLTGTVNESVNNDRFSLTLRNGQTIVVTTDDNVRISRNSTVLVNGRWNRDTQRFRADTVRILDNSTNTGDVTRVNFPATVLELGTGNRISVRGDNNRTYEITIVNSLDRNIRRGDRVRISGTVDRDGLVRADRIVLERDYESSSLEGMIDFYGTITEVPFLLLRQYYSVRGEDGRDYRVNFNRSTNLRKGDFVRIQGKLNNGVVTAEILERG